MPPTRYAEKSVVVVFTAAPGAEQATIPAPNGNHMAHHQGTGQSVCRMGAKAPKNWKRQWGGMVTILSEEVLVKYQLTLAEGEGTLALPWPGKSDRTKPGRTRLREGTPLVIDIAEKDMVHLSKTYRGRVAFERVKDSTKADVSAPAKDDGDKPKAEGRKLKSRNKGKQPAKAPKKSG